MLLVAAESPASIIGETLAGEPAGSGEIFDDNSDVVCPEVTMEAVSGISTNALSETAEFLPALLPDATQYAASGIAGGGEQPGPSILSRAAEYSESPGVWMIVISPWVGCVVFWHMPPPHRRRHRRYTQ